MRAGDYHVGIRSDDASVLEGLRTRYSERLVDDDRGEADFGVIFSEVPNGGGTRLLPSLVHGRRPVLRSRNSARILHRLDVELGVLAAPIDPGVFELEEIGAIVAGDRAVLVPGCAFKQSSAIERLAARAGATLAEPTGVRLDPDAGQVVVPVGLCGDQFTLSAPPGRFAIAAILWDEAQMGSDERPALALARLLTHVRDLAGVDADALAGLARLQVATFSAAPVRCDGRIDVSAAIACLAADDG